MLLSEAKWIAGIIAECGDSLFPLLNVGSHSEAFRKTSQPWMDELIFGPLRATGKSVTHLDLVSAPGVDIAGDVNDQEIQRQVRARNFKSVLCSNLLEHVSDPQSVARVIQGFIPSGGKLIVTCPYKFPYHPDPLDTMFRPSINELAELFRETHLRSHHNVVDQTVLSLLLFSFLKSPGRAVKTLLSKPTGTKGHPELSLAVGFIPWLFTKTEASCILLEKA